MDILSRNISKRGLDVIDDWLKNEGYFRKNAPHDAACLFRAVSEQIYLTQYYHLRVRKECVDYMRKNKQQFQKDVKGCIDDYLDRLSCVTEWAGFTEIRAMAQLYKCQFIMFDAKQRSIYPATDGDSEKKINLCQINQNVYEGVFQKELIATAAFCQSLIYQTLYKNVFEIPEADEIAKRMLRDRPFNIKFDKSFSKNNFGQGESSNQDQSENLDTDDVIDPSPNMKLEKAPFPLRIAKALDPNIYRNTEFDTWHELRKEVKYSGWTNWNNSELQIGAKCLVQLDYDKENIEDVNDDKEQLDHNDNVAPEKSKKVLIGHIQEMTKGEGPVVVFIEELGEKRTVPFKALKPLLASRRPQVPLGVIIPRRNLSLDQVTKWRIRSNPSPKKLKDTDCNSSTANVDMMKNNNKHNSHYNVKKLDKRTNWAEKNNVAVSPKTILKPLTAIENYSVNNNNNFIEVRPVSVIMDNPPPLSNPGNEQKEEKIKTLNNNNTTTPTNNNNNNNNPTVVNNSINPMNGYEKLQVQGADGNATPGVNQVPMNNQPSPIPLQHDPYFNQSPGPMYAPNPGVICLPSEGALYPMPYYTGQGEMQSAGGQESHLRAINITSPLSNDINGSDLPYSDPATLRFFYNLGVETFRCGQMWQPRGLITYGPPHMPQGAVVPMMSPALPTDPPPNFQTSPHNDEKSGQNNSAQNNSGQNNARQNFQQNRRRNDQSNTGRNPGMNPDNRGNQRNFPRKDSRENFTRNESNPQDYQKNRPGFGANDKDGNRDQKKNNSRFKKTNEPRPRNFERGQLQQEYQKPRDNLQGHNYKPNENNGFQRGNNNDNLLQPLPQFGMQGSPSPSSGSNPPFQGNYGQQPVYNNVQYYQNDSENFYPPTPNYYPVPFVPPPQQPPPQEVTEGNNNVPSYICSGPESFPPPGSPIYPHYVFPPPAMYPNPAPANSQEGWIPMPSNQGPFVPFQVPGNQPTNVSRPPPTSS